MPEVVSQQEDDDIQIATQESLKDVVKKSGQSLPGVSIKEPDTGRMKLLPHVEGKGKKVATKELVAETLLHISSPASKSKEPLYILKRKSLETSKFDVESTDVTEEQSQTQELELALSDTDSDKEGPNDELTAQPLLMLKRSLRLTTGNTHKNHIQTYMMSSLQPPTQVLRRILSSRLMIRMSY